MFLLCYLSEVKTYSFILGGDVSFVWLTLVLELLAFAAGFNSSVSRHAGKRRLRNLVPRRLKLRWRFEYSNLWKLVVFETFKSFRICCGF